MRRGSWLHKGLIVKIMAKELKQAGLLKCKGVIRKLPKPGVAEIAVIDPEAVVQVGSKSNHEKSNHYAEHLLVQSCTRYLRLHC